MTWEEDLLAAEIDPKAAARVLGHVADFLRRGVMLPPELVKHVAGAFEAAAVMEGVTGVERGKVLARDLFLVTDRLGAPKKLSDEDVQIHYAATAFSACGHSRNSFFEAMREAGYRTTSSKAKWRKMEAEANERVDESARDFERWLAMATPEQVEVFNREGLVCSRDFAVFVLDHPNLAIHELVATFKGQ